MARSAPWRRAVSDIVSWRQDQGIQATIYIVREHGPTAFLLKEEGESKLVKAFLGDPHNCTCQEFRKDRDLCKHLCWLLLKRFRIPREDPISWQLGLVEREINSILRTEDDRRSTRNRPETARKASVAAPSGDGRPALEQREISPEDTCPICMEELLAKREPVTFCRYSCANSIHIKCMKIWAEHQTSTGDKVIKCPFCREDFGPAEYLREEYRNTVVPSLQRQRVTEHPGTLCRNCSQSPITGKCYRCTVCNEFHLCQKCLNTSVHTQHTFEFRAHPGKRWRPVKRVATDGLTLPSALVSDMMNRDLGDQDYDLLLQLDNQQRAEISQIPERVIQGLPVERVRPGSRYLAPGEQCCVCLRPYAVGDILKRLPCRHKYHKDCIDNWLLHQHPTCPVDGETVWSSITADTTDVTAGPTRPRRRRVNQPTNTNNRAMTQSEDSITLEIPGIGITRLLPNSAPAVTSSEHPSSSPTGTIGSETNTAIHIRRERSNASSTSSDPMTGDSSLTVNLAQLLRLPSSDITHHLVGSDQGETPLSLVDHVQQENSDEPAIRYQAISQHTPIRTLNTTTATADTASNDNSRRRSRNMALAVQHRLMAYGANQTLQVQAPSITTKQPVGVSSLYLGNNPTSSDLQVESVANRYVPRRTVLNKRPTATSAPSVRAGNLSSLQIGDAAVPVMGGITRTMRRPTKLKDKAKNHSIHQPNVGTLELNGTTCRW